MYLKLFFHRVFLSGTRLHHGQWRLIGADAWQTPLHDQLHRAINRDPDNLILTIDLAVTIEFGVVAHLHFCQIRCWLNL